MRTRKIAKTDSPQTKQSPKRQLIGEELGVKRLIEKRLFQTAEEVEIWTRAAPGRRVRLARVGSAAWRRALDEELRIAQRAECAKLPKTKHIYRATVEIEVARQSRLRKKGIILREEMIFTNQYRSVRLSPSARRNIVTEYRVG